MALNEPDTRDPRLERLYRDAGHEEPPAHLDAAILAAARREAGARRDVEALRRRGTDRDRAIAPPRGDRRSWPAAGAAAPPCSRVSPAAVSGTACPAARALFGRERAGGA